MERKEERIEQGVGVSGYMASFAGCPVNFKSNTFGVCEFKPPHGAFWYVYIFRLDVVNIPQPAIIQR